ncbi:hypothetical protein SAMN04489742_2305 [Arthrobacter crystallopoietes]|uniref:Uncharacterized protein n=1 Tax=Crystallibacter crystallopoietes TaxID=37928 RepID=A0A1H1D7X7_9MICC|nr:hypothetical protein SAMN04489742_2305 [Arthrobacter crystallopoietes]
MGPRYSRASGHSILQRIPRGKKAVTVGINPRWHLEAPAIEWAVERPLEFAHAASQDASMQRLLLLSLILS